MIQSVFIFGYGYTANFFATMLTSRGFKVYGTSRDSKTRQLAREQGVTLCDFDNDAIVQLLNKSQAILITIPPDEKGEDLVFARFQSVIKTKIDLNWLGYLSTTGVYGDHNGDWVTEESDCINPGDRAQQRIHAERKWLSLFINHNIPVHIFRLAGIYGPDRNNLIRIQSKDYFSVFKQGQYFSRIHVEDIATVLLTSLLNPKAGQIYNLSDDCPANTCDVDSYTANLLGIKIPKAIPYEQADLSPMAKEFYSSNKRVSNHKIKSDLRVKLLYPSYQEGLISILKKQNI